jgi:hypothetical protein
MGSVQKRPDEPVLRGRRTERQRLECRECEIVCERVVSPWHCLKSNCTYVYSYEDDDTTYFGCLYKVFSPELDLAAFTGRDGRPGKGPDPYGPVRVARTPRPPCRVWTERAYETGRVGQKCCNPAFLCYPAPRG